MPHPSHQSRSAQALLLMLRAYKLMLSPLLSGYCRFSPSCGDYAIEAIKRHGAGHGGLLTAKRLIKCRPLGGHGFDPVP